MKRLETPPGKLKVGLQNPGTELTGIVNTFCSLPRLYIRKGMGKRTVIISPTSRRNINRKKSFAFGQKFVPGNFSHMS